MPPEPVFPSQSVVMPPNFHPFSGVIPSISSRSRSTNSFSSDAWSRHRIMPHQPRIHQSLAEASVAYQQSPERDFQPARDITSRSVPAAAEPPVQAPGLSLQPQYGGGVTASTDNYGYFAEHSGYVSFPPVGPSPRLGSYRPHSSRMVPETHGRYNDMVQPLDATDYLIETNSRRSADKSRGASRYCPQRRSTNRDEFDGPHQLLDLPSPETIAAQEKELPHLPTNLDVSEQDRILTAVNDRLSKCAFDFVAKYQFPIPLDPDKREVREPSDREWTEWVYLLRRLATKRRIPARVLYNGQIKQFVTILENSLEMRHAALHQSRPVKDDRNVLQLISAATQVSKILKDASAMRYLDNVYVQTEKRIQERRNRRVKFALP